MMCEQRETRQRRAAVAILLRETNDIKHINFGSHRFEIRKFIWGNGAGTAIAENIKRGVRSLFAALLGFLPG